MAKNYFNRYVWLIDVISRHGHITKSRIDNLWRISSLNEDHETKIPDRTFHNQREAIWETFGIEIGFERGSGYYIVNTDDLEADGIRQWLLESMSLNNLLSESSGMRNRILFESVPSSSKWLSVIVNAMRDGMAMEMTYQSFKRTESTTFETHPYCLKIFRNRWYMLSKSVDKDEPRIYSLDRIIDIQVLDKALELPVGFDAAEFFSDYFGIIIGKNVKPSLVDIKATAEQAKYLESLPLHISQEAIEKTPEYTIFRYCLVPTLDFKQELLSRGSTLEVLSPEWFRKDVIDELYKTLHNYGQ